MKRKLQFLGVVLALLSITYAGRAQERTVTGTVTDVIDNSPLPGAAVFIKGTTSGTTTDINGKYSIAVPSGATLVFSFVGLTSQEVEVGSRSVVDVVMQSDATELAEVVVTAIGIEREKKALGYAVTNLDNTLITQRSEPDPVRTLQGKIPGVNIQGGGGAPGQATKINIRGVSSLTGNTQPLFVVDGVPFDNSVNASTGASGGTQYSNRLFDLDPNNIESLTVLKGAAAAALYGSRATNGAIIITTKAAKKGVKKGMEVTYSSSYSREEISGIPDYQNIYTQGSNQNYNGGFIGNWGAPFPEYVDQLNAQYGTNYSKTYAPGYPEGTVPHPLVANSFGIGQGYRNVFPELMEEDPNNPGSLRPVPVELKSYDIIGGFFEAGNLFENSLNISSSTDKTTLIGTVSRMDNDGIVPNSKTSRTNLSFGGNGVLANGLFLSGNVNYVNTQQQTPQSGSSFFFDYTGSGTSSIYSRIFYLPRNYNLMGYPFENPVTGDNVFYRSLDNPRWIAEYNLYNSVVNRVFGTINLSYDVAPWLNLMAKGGINTYTENRRNIVRPGGTVIPSGEVWTDDLTNTEQDYNFIATLSKDFSETFAFRGIVGTNLNQRQFSQRRVTGTGIIQTGLNITNATTTQVVNRDYTRLRRFYAIYSDLQFSYRDLLFLNLTGRNDWSSTLPVSDNSYFYPGISSSFIFTEALQGLPTWIDYGKIRASATKVGNDATPYLTNTYYSIQTPFEGVNRATLGNTLGNPNLKPEFTTEYEAGIEARVFGGRIGLDFTYFHRTSTNQIIDQSRIPASSGFNYEVINAGELLNKGIEVGLDVTPIKTKSGFVWNTFFSFTRIRSIVVDAGVEGGTLFIGGPFSTLGVVHRSGEQYGQIFGSKNTRDAEGNLLINEVSGLPFVLPSSEIIGNPNPDFLLGINNTFSFKNFTLTALIDWKQGGQLFSSSAASLLLRGQLKMSEDREGLRVVPGVYGNPQTYEPILDDQGNEIRNTTAVTSFDYHFSNGFGAYGADETNVYDATVIRLREVTLGYSFPQTLLSKTPLGSARISISGRNLFWVAPNMLEGLNMDPEVLAEFPDSNIQGFEYGATPTTRRYGVNLSVTF
ncbi:TonB-linked outer membrane protein, SusC/RagA family [Catalinimonas alkaloidigena]|uniref:TonB-linked outer membrane protein, SusC/RagA family n=1 Tax=Catalinimonas alkaloidigena TaxID=1075417 RepID=A0A1G9NIE9_9BACT|nr:SusC/RagA family TonB-linked outer membrane protein [Catalinimonas alkaloidigena]SDL86199.1 TonB-linked outer membrane protein, SusC/RagA family [Catalinimonas alkaloidigena]